MRARDMAQPTEVIRLDTPALDALRMLAESGQPGLVIAVDESFVVVPASQVLRVALPRYVIDDAALGRVWDEPSADAIAARLAGRTLADLAKALDPSRDENRPDHVVDGEANLVEIAAVMAAAHVPLVAVVDEGVLLGMITVNQLIRSVLA
ncbi:MAG: CBS domain-containing protein [Candidatus Nanopelagicales bacterium]